MFVKLLSVVALALLFTQASSIACPCSGGGGPTVTIPLPLPPVIPLGKVCSCKSIAIKPSLLPAGGPGCAPPVLSPATLNALLGAAQLASPALPPCGGQYPPPPPPAFPPYYGYPPAYPPWGLPPTLPPCAGGLPPTLPPCAGGLPPALPPCPPPPFC